MFQLGYFRGKKLRERSACSALAGFAMLYRAAFHGLSKCFGDPAEVVV
jgi:hypothetical protein